MSRVARLARLLATLLLIALATPSGAARLSASPGSSSRLDALLQDRAALRTGRSRVIISAVDSKGLPSLRPLIRVLGGVSGRHLPGLDALVADVPNAALPLLARSTFVQRISFDRMVAGSMERTSAAVGAAAAREAFGYDGSGIGIAVIDSGVTSWHDDLGGPGGGQRIARFVNFVGERQLAHDDYGHGTHVAGIVAGNGYDSGGQRQGIAPGAHLIVLKVLDGSGTGRISDVIAALDYVVEHRHELNIRVVNLSVAAGVYESYATDPLTLAARRAVMAGIVVVAAAGNIGRGPDGQARYGGITAPGNAPWVLTVGASSHAGTHERADDTMAPFSSRGPSAIDHAAKPDIVAPGVGIESLSDPNSALYSTRSASLLPGTVPLSYLPYLSMSGSSMAAPVAAGTVALMLQANPALAPNAVKAILQYTAEAKPVYDPLTQGAGFLNAAGAVALARYFAAPSGSYPETSAWSGRMIWGNRYVQGGRLMPGANAWSADVPWGADITLGGEQVEWGVVCPDSACDTGSSWIATDGDIWNVVWGSLCGGANCSTPWTWAAVSSAEDDEGDTVVWGTGDEGDTVVWGTSDDGDTVVWGTGDDEGDTVVWGTTCSDPSCLPMIWPSH